MFSEHKITKLKIYKTMRKNVQSTKVLVATWKITFLSTPRQLKPLSLYWRHHLLHYTARSSAEGQQQHLLTQRLINWLIGCLRCKVIDWLSWGWSCLYLEPWGANLWRSTVICHVQHTGEDEGEMKSCEFITKTWEEGMYRGSLSQD